MSGIGLSAPKQTILVCLLTQLLACTSIDVETTFVEDAEIYNSILDQDRELFAEIDPLFIDDEVKQFLDANISPRDNEETRVDILQDLLYGEDFLNVQYSDKKTHTAMEAFYAREGNCLSIMNLYIAMARYVEVDAVFQTVEVQPSWNRRGGLLVLNQHINATGRFGIRRRYIVDFTPEIALQQLTSNEIDDQQARALYFNNLGVEDLLAEKMESALIYFKNALFLDPDLSIAWNNIGTVYKQMENFRFAEYSYGRAFQLDDSNATAINNLAKFYRATGNTVLAQEYELAIERFNNRNPYFHFAQGIEAFLLEDFETARRSLRRAIRIKDQEPDFYIALANTYAGLGDLQQAQFYQDSADRLLVQNEEIYQPSNNKVRIIDSATIFRDSSPGISIIAPGGGRSGSRN